MNNSTFFDLVLENADISTFSTQDSQKIYREEIVNIGIKDGKILSIGSGPLSGNKRLDLKGLKTLPGIIDSQVHFREPGMTHKEDLSTGTLGAALGGVTSIFEMPNTIPATTTQELLEQKMALAGGRAWVNYAFFVGAAVENISTLGQLESLPGCSGIKIFMGSSTGSLLVEDDQNLEKILLSGRRRVIVHSEDEARLRERKPLAVNSKDVRNHCVWRDPESAFRSTKRLLHLAEKTKRPVHVLHVTSAEEMTLLSKFKHRASVEVLPQHLTLSAPECYERLGTLAQQNPPIREAHHQEALWQGIANGTVDVIGSDHAPHTLEEKSRPYPGSPSGMPGVQTLVPVMLNHIANKKLNLKRFIELVCENPRWVFGCHTKGRIEIGMDADFSIVDLKRMQAISNSWIASRSAWTPFDGFKVQGWPIMTIVGGQLVMRDSQILERPVGKPVEFKF